jgi:hypothetical protein
MSAVMQSRLDADTDRRLAVCHALNTCCSRYSLLRWNDPQIVSLNPLLYLPAIGITVVLQTEARSLILVFSEACARADPDFASSIPAAAQPVWPTQRYAASARVKKIDGAASYVLDHPYSLGISTSGTRAHGGVCEANGGAGMCVMRKSNYTCMQLTVFSLLSAHPSTGVANRLGSTLASMLTSNGAISTPDAASIAVAFDELVVTSSVNSIGEEVYAMHTNEISATASVAWPYMVDATLILAADYAAESCITRSEVIKFMNWILADDSIRYRLAMQESIALLSASANEQLGVASTFTELTCGGNTIGRVATPTINFNGVYSSTVHVNFQRMILASYSASDTVYTYASRGIDEGEAMQQVSDPSSQTDVLR